MDHNESSKARLRALHTPAAIQDRLHGRRTHTYLRDFVYGAVDGIVTTFAVVSGVAGAGLSSGVVIVLGAANLAGDGFSMAASNYLGTRADRQLVARARMIEEEHVAGYPEGEREEIRQIFREKGLTGDDLNQMVSLITADRKRWIDTMIHEEYGLSVEGPSAWRAALITFAAFVLFGALPLLSFIYEFFASASLVSPYVSSSVATGVAFFVVGAIKGRFVEERWYRAGAETLLIGGAAAALAYLVGIVLKDVVS
jgi:VIT1/CCC1 family predicted Fe2+/Mn2+ transporter